MGLRGAFWVALATLAVAFGIALLIYFHDQHSGSPANVKDDRARVDTVVALKTRVDTITLRVDNFVHDTRQSAATGRTAAARLDSEAAAVRDTAPVVAYERERARGDTLERLGLTLSAGLDTVLADRDRWKLVADSAIPLTQHLQSDLERATKPCKILWLVKCPSRLEAVALGIVAGGILVAHPPRLSSIVRL